MAKINRFELVTVIATASAISFAALYVTAELSGLHADRTCLAQWVASVPTSPQCTNAVAVWGAINEDHGGRVMAAMALAPFIIGILTGAPLVAREFEDGTAPFSWSLAGSREKWLWYRLVPMLGFVLVASALVATAAASLAETRTAGGIWSSLYDTATLYGFPIVARAAAAFLLAVCTGAIVGRTLPTTIASIAVVIALAIGTGAAQGQFVRPTLPITGIGAPGYVSAFLALNPDTEVVFVESSGAILTYEQAIAAAPPGVPSLGDWLQSRYQFVPVGIKRQKAAEWQLIDTGAYSAVSLFACLGTVAVINRRRPT